LYIDIYSASHDISQTEAPTLTTRHNLRLNYLCSLASRFCRWCCSRDAGSDNSAGRWAEPMSTWLTSSAVD